MTIDTAIRMDSEDTPTPYLSIQASDGTSRYALQQYLIDFKRIRILEQDYELTGQEEEAPEAPPLIAKRLIKERDKLAGALDRLVIIVSQRRKEMKQLRQRIDELLAERDDLEEERQHLLGECNQLTAERDQLARECNRLAKERDEAVETGHKAMDRIDEKRKALEEAEKERDEALADVYRLESHVQALKEMLE